MSAPDEPKLLSEQTYQAAKRDIIRCVLSPASEWTEQQLRARYRVGIATSRAAIAKLVQDGLLLAVPRRGYQVPAITLRDVTETFDLRAIVEPGVARRATEVISTAQIAGLKQMVDRVRRSNLRTAEQFIHANREFHIAIANVCGNARCTRIVSRLLDDAERILHAGVFTIARNKEFLDSHDEIIELMEQGDVVAVEGHVRDHVDAAKSVVVNAIYTSEKVLDVNLA